MDWTETSPGVFGKELDGVEKIYRHASQVFKHLDREHWGLYCVSTLETDRSVSDEALTKTLRNAWIALRHDFPSLAVVPEGLDKKTYVIPDASSVESWAEKTFHVDENGSPEGIVAAYTLRDLPNLYYFPDTAEVLFLASHWRIDGLGTCMLLDQFFHHVAKRTPCPPPEAWINDLDKISPSLEHAAGAPTNSAADEDLKAYARAYIENHHKTAVNAGGLPYEGDNATAPGRPASASLTLSRASTAALVAACKARGLSVTSAVHAALASAVFALGEATSGSGLERYSAVMSVNMRKHLLAPYNGQTHAVSTYVTGVTPSVDRSMTFEDRARHLLAFYRGWYSDRFVRGLRLTTQYHFEALARRPAPVEGAPRPKPPSSVTLSSLGVVDHYLAGRWGADGPRIRNFRFGVSMMTRQMLLYVWTFDGNLTLSVNYNDAYRSQDSIMGFLEFIKDDLQKELKVPLVLES